uniref:Lipoprotein n=1 Tax=Prevotella sp. GTC17262 TaxID=3236797 RepID=A0AB33JQ33_9BACT
MLVAMATVFVTSCSNDDEIKDPIYHQHYFQGKLNNHDISMNDVNANIISAKSDMGFGSITDPNVPGWFKWEVTLMETKDTVITLHLRIDDVERTNEMIYSPNDNDPIKSNSTCYATVKDLKNKTTSIYHPTHPAPIDVAWETFMVKVDKNNIKNVTKEYDDKLDFTKYKWPGIKGELFGTLTSDDESKSPLKIKMKFVVY